MARASRLRSKLYEKLGVPDQFDPEASYTTSPFFSPSVLAFIRLSLAFYTFFTLLFVLVWNSVIEHAGDTYFSYFTELSYIGICSYFCASGVQTIVYALSRGKSYPLQRWPRALQFLHVLLFSTISTFPILVTIVYWAALHPSSPFTSKYEVWSNVSLHLFNTVFALFEVLCTRAGPTPWTHIPFVIILLACYLGVAYITHATQGFYTYSFLDPSTEHATLAGWIIGIAAATIVIFTVTHLLCVLRNRLARKFGCTTVERTESTTRGERLGLEHGDTELDVKARAETEAMWKRPNDEEVANTTHEGDAKRTVSNVEESHSSSQSHNEMTH